jgi:hypothetical protein
MIRATLLASLLWAGIAQAQTAAYEGKDVWEVGVLGGFGWTNSLTAKGPTASATTGLHPGAVIGAFGGEDMYDHLSGEARYLYRFSDLKLSSGGTSVDFGGHMHIAEGAFLYQFTRRGSHIRPFFAFGGGIKVLQGTGRESAVQPLGRFAALTATREVLPTADVGFGFKVNLREHLRLRIEVRDYISGTPGKVIAPAPGVSISGAMNDVTGLVGFSYIW